ncbi:MAG TPA: ComF family protein [bacterium]|jgi:ComF family protein|nr:ComF family protein [Myxococcales bacterium]OQA60964.1 MAG: DNA utilization protein GntX [bacterium ADurb.Bin270]HPW45453.1 ComF family protein [bacterium]HQC50578.1 ComF family protein [bacterium]HQG12857.1 ComF family protein [bacterium]
MSFLFDVAASLLRIVYPPRCPLCGNFQTEELTICDECSARAIRVDAGPDISQLGAVYLDSCISCFAFEGGVRGCVHSFKYGEAINLAGFIGREIHSKLRQTEEFDMIIPVPLHSRKLKLRGYNQAALIAEIVSKRSGKRAEKNLLKRIRNDSPQATLHRVERIRNVKSSFAISKRAEGVVRGKRILLVDDVMTTGATLNECAKILKKAGAAVVVGITFARATI